MPEPFRFRRPEQPLPPGAASWNRQSSVGGIRFLPREEERAGQATERIRHASRLRYLSGHEWSYFFVDGEDSDFTCDPWIECSRRDSARQMSNVPCRNSTWDV